MASVIFVHMTGLLLEIVAIMVFMESKAMQKASLPVRN
ncbi:hypothetical protein A6R68_08113 [Neotoma lepida]|uniref:Uncharacterized protein n=1 Tax=Neotoma lepida TaxID=56216 RepID=A0A1A6G611_NEOLE|nr:hypothetical protein A6R68_08113 [Neotoma lepida]